MNEEQAVVLEFMDNQILIVGFTPIQTLIMVLSYYKGGYYEKMTEKEFECVVKTFVEKYM